jgi:hypothetical protein
LIRSLFAILVPDWPPSRRRNKIGDSRQQMVNARGDVAMVARHGRRQLEELSFIISGKVDD